MSDQSLLAIFANGALFLTFVAFTLFAVHWNDARRWWARFGEALQDIDGRDQ